jgi:hypothetical protein
MDQGEHLTIEGLHKIVSIRASMNKGLSDVLKTDFPDIQPVERPKLELPKNIDPNWLVGFVEGDGCFMINTLKSQAYKLGIQTQLNFTISQHYRDEQLMKSLSEYLGCGVLKKDSRGSAIYWVVTRFSDLTAKILPFFNKYPLQGSK